jgi:hypothetical protein
LVRSCPPPRRSCAPKRSCRLASRSSCSPCRTRPRLFAGLGNRCR